MSKLLDELKLPLSDALNEFPKRSGGKLIHIATVYRWASVGVRGVILETVVVGGLHYTSKEAVARFIEATTKARRSMGLSTAQQESIVKAHQALRQKRSQQAETRLKAAGV